MDGSGSGLRILYFSKDYTTHDRRFLEALADTDHEIFYLQLERSDSLYERRELPAGIHALEWAGGKKRASVTDGLNLIISLKRILAEVQPDLVQAGPIQSCALLTVLAGYHPLVSTSWGSDLLVEAERSPWMRLVTKYVLRHSEVLVGDCEPVRQKAIGLGMPDERVVTFPWGIELEKFTSSERNRESMQNEDSGSDNFQREFVHDFVLLSTRSWEPIYGVDVVVRAFSRTVRQLEADNLHAALKLILLGSGSQENYIKDLVHAEGLETLVHLPGRVAHEQLPLVYRQADIYISASHSDGTSISLLEAMASELPVIVSDIPGNLEWVTPGKEGWVFPDGDEQALAQAILHAVQSPGLLNEMGKAGREKVEDLADWDKNFPHLLHAYELACEITASGKTLYAS